MYQSWQNIECVCCKMLRAGFTPAFLFSCSAPAPSVHQGIQPFSNTKQFAVSQASFLIFSSPMKYPFSYSETPFYQKTGKFWQQLRIKYKRQ